jgi:hypothetical protein
MGATRSQAIIFLLRDATGEFFYCSFYAKSRVVILQLSMGSRSRISADPLVGARQQIDRRWPGQDDPSPPGLLFTERSVFSPHKISRHRRGTKRVNDCQEELAAGG